MHYIFVGEPSHKFHEEKEEKGNENIIHFVELPFINIAT